MSAYTTKRMTKQQVILMILSELPNANYDVLERIGDVLLERSLYNVRIVPKGMEDQPDD